MTLLIICDKVIWYVYLGNVMPRIFRETGSAMFSQDRESFAVVLLFFPVFFGKKASDFMRGEAFSMCQEAT